MYSLTVLETRRSKSRCRQGHAPSGGSRGGSVPCLFPLLMAVGAPWLLAASFQSLPQSYCLFLFDQSSLALTLKRTLSLKWEVTWILQDKCLLSGFLIAFVLHCKVVFTHLPHEVIFTDSGHSQDMGVSFGRPPFHPLRLSCPYVINIKNFLKVLLSVESLSIWVLN